jgi:lipopolysaccharide export system ATP-binding protein
MSKNGRETLETFDLTKSYNGRMVVDRVSLQIRAGEVVGLLGPNGAGKTTTFYMIIGLIRPDRGRVLFNGEDIGTLPMYQRARRGITYLPQEPSVFRKLTVEENILAILETLNIVREERERRLRKLLEELKIAHLAKNKAYSLSGGERRRLEITRALVLSPSLILLDEPFAGIDPLAVIDIQNIIRQLKKRGIGVIVTDHNVREALHVCDRAYILNEGRILEAGSPKKIAASKKAREIYLGEHFRLERRGRGNKDGAAEPPRARQESRRAQSRAQSQNTRNG